MGHRNIFGLATVQLNEFFWQKKGVSPSLPLLGLSPLAREGVGGIYYHTRVAATTIGHNPLALLLPCHRVAGRDGKLRSFASGIEVKRRLLTMGGG